MVNSRAEILLIPEFCPGGQRQGLTVNNSTLQCILVITSTDIRALCETQPKLA